MSRYDVVKRHQYADYLNVGTADKEDFVLMGAGFTTLDENPSAQSESTKYVNEVSASSEVVGYETSFPLKQNRLLMKRLLMLCTRSAAITLSAPMPCLITSAWSCGTKLPAAEQVKPALKPVSLLFLPKFLPFLAKTSRSLQAI